MDNQRKASDVLLDLESKIDLLLNIVRAQDLNIKILSNKLKSIIDLIGAVPQQPSSKPFIEVSDEFANKNIPVQASVPQTDSNPLGFRRTSRHETYAPTQPSKPVKKPAVEPEIVVPTKQVAPAIIGDKQVLVSQKNEASAAVIQRVVDKNGKSVFFAEVEITDKQTYNVIAKCKTNSAGKWTASLPIGEYKVVVRKKEAISKEKSETTQDVVIDGSSYNITLPLLLLK